VLLADPRRRGADGLAADSDNLVEALLVDARSDNKLGDVPLEGIEAHDARE